jgi:hypothetical protein
LKCRYWRVPKRRSGTRFGSNMHALWLAAMMILLAKTTAGLLHPGTFGALKATGMSVYEASTVVGEMLARRVRGQTR